MIKRLNRRSTRVRRRGGFTLVELLIVLAIIAVLIGIVMRLASYVNMRVGRARAAAQIQQVRQMLAGYYAVYGTYPPERTTNAAWNVPFIYIHKPPDTNFVEAGEPPGDIGCCTGLLYYLGYQRSDQRTNYYNPNPAAKRWQHLLGGVEWLHWMEPTNVAGYGGNYVRRRHTLVDPWDQDYRYRCPYP